SLRSCLATSTWLSPVRRRAAAIAAPSAAEISRFFSFAIFVFYAPLAKQNRCQYSGANTSPTRWGGTTTHLLLDRLAQANRAQSCGFELPTPGLMSFHNVTLPSAPNLYSSLPVVGLTPESQAAFSKMDEGVESGSPIPN